jgi:hypothetical protein
MTTPTNQPEAGQRWVAKRPPAIVPGKWTEYPVTVLAKVGFDQVANEAIFDVADKDGKRESLGRYRFVRCLDPTNQPPPPSSDSSGDWPKPPAIGKDKAPSYMTREALKVEVQRWRDQFDDLANVLGVHPSDSSGEPTMTRQEAAAAMRTWLLNEAQCPDGDCIDAMWNAVEFLAPTETYHFCDTEPPTLELCPSCGHERTSPFLTCQGCGEHEWPDQPATLEPGPEPASPLPFRVDVNQAQLCILSGGPGDGLVTPWVRMTTPTHPTSRLGDFMCMAHRVNNYPDAIKQLAAAKARVAELEAEAAEQRGPFGSAGFGGGTGEMSSGELEMTAHVGPHQGRFWLSREMWEALGEAAGWSGPSTADVLDEVCHELIRLEEIGRASDVVARKLAAIRATPGDPTP